MRYLLDTTALIDYSKGREPAQTRILALIETGEEVGVCAVNVAEFYAGLAPSTHQVWDQFIESLSYWHIGREAAARAGQERYELARRGQTISLADALVGAAAREYDATLITSNVRDYPMPDLRLLSIRE
ncbi:MAG TPA: type II toxin-antitoxin system VapC family toxin [Chloroflexota bacterium]|nr:type II toxin-antitoxin system VapC family toxin [Chloroflexota bacterium]